MLPLRYPENSTVKRLYVQDTSFFFITNADA
jgi:hypothetical protein